MTLQSLLTGSDVPLRKTRFHDEKGNFVSFRYLVSHGPLALLSLINLKIFGVRAEKPWLSYAAIKEINQFLTPDKNVLEFGSGMSTIWFAKKSRQVFSVENFEPWYNKVKELLTLKKFDHVNYNFKQGEDYSSFMADGNIKFDFILIDGYRREECARNAVRLLKDGGMIYLDNSDKDSNPDFAKDNTRLAEEILIEFGKSKGGTIKYFSDFAPAAFFVQQGLMIKV